MSELFNYIELSQSTKSKKNAIVEGILDAIRHKVLVQGDPLPSVNRMTQRLGVARMTVVKALNVLKEKGIVVSEDKIGFFIKDINVKRELKVFLFLNGFYSYHETIYDSIIEGISGQDITIDLYFHHCNPRIFKTIINENLGSYGLYVISGFDDPQVISVLSKIPSKKLLQIIREPVLEGVSSIIQDFYSGLKRSLENLKERLSKYQRFVLVFPQRKGHPERIKTAFADFCAEIGIEHQIEKKVTLELISKGTAFWVIEDSDLISLIKIGEEMNLKLGHDLGILSYNETPMKEIIRNGISVVSVDFVKLGQSISRFITNPRPTTEIYFPEVIIRNSI
jgi:DNA-binding transcriptional regulator YhcF (GntR family)